MTTTPQRRPTRLVEQILAEIKISQVYRELADKEPRRTGPDTWRAVAVWRDGDGFNVSLDDARGVWHDFTTGDGGGVLDLVVQIRGGSRQDALRWAADSVGCPLEDRPLSASLRVRWAREHRRTELELPKARLWRRGAVALSELILDGLKAALADPKLPWPEIGEIAYWTTQLAAWRRLDGVALVDEYLWWAEHQPHLTGGMIYAATLRETAERRALCRFLGISEAEGRR